jgi:alpha-amylase
MVKRCNNVAVRIYTDAVINHMSAFSGNGSAGSSFDLGSRSYPGVPYGPFDFTDKKCKSATGGIESYNDANQVRDCNLVGLPDLALSTDYVRNMVAEYMNRLIDIAGFRIEAAKHM